MLTDIIQTPDTNQIRRDLEYMTARWSELAEPAKFELRAFKENVSPKIGTFTPERIDEAVDWAESFNENGYNIYAVRNPIRLTASATGAAKDTDIIASFFLWADCDEPIAANNVFRFDGPKWSASVTTGTVPTIRAHTYWMLDKPCTDMAEWRDMQTTIAAHFHSDPSVVNPSRIMRLGGTVSYPAKHKQERGYVKEQCKLRTEYNEERPPVSLEQMWIVFKGQKPAFQVDTGIHKEYSEPLDRERTAIKALSGQEWNNEVFKLVGSYVKRGLSDAEIHNLTDALTTGGYTVDQTRTEVQNMIDRTRKKAGFEPVPVYTPSKPPKEDENTDWHHEIIVNGKGRPVFNTANVATILANEPELKDTFAFDEFRQVKIMTRELPWKRGRPAVNFKGRDVTDTDIFALVVWFNKNGFPEATKNTIADAVDLVSHETTFHPVRNYLNGLPEWDGVSRINKWLAIYCNAAVNNEEDMRYILEVGRSWLISAVARAMRPGCKADAVLILEGPQGARKSTALKVLCGEDWFGDSLPPMHNKDASSYLRGKWIIEMAELSNINKAEVEVAKAFISRSEERFRPAYGRNEVTYPRQCVFAGSTNKNDYLRDETGNRRFWPVTVHGLCDTDGLKEDRDQIWAEALKAFNDGDPWWLTEKAEALAATHQSNRVAQDAWHGEVEQFCNSRFEVSPTAVAVDGLKIEIGRVDRLTSNRITAILAALGYVRKGQFTSGEQKGRAKYVLEENDEHEE